MKLMLNAEFDVMFDIRLTDVTMRHCDECRSCYLIVTFANG